MSDKALCSILTKICGETILYFSAVVIQGPKESFRAILGLGFEGLYFIKGDWSSPLQRSTISYEALSDIVCNARGGPLLLLRTYHKLQTDLWPWGMNEILLWSANRDELVSMIRTRSLAYQMSTGSMRKLPRRVKRFDKNRIAGILDVVNRKDKLLPRAKLFPFQNYRDLNFRGYSFHFKSTYTVIVSGASYSTDTAVLRDKARNFWIELQIARPGQLTSSTGPHDDFHSWINQYKFAETSSSPGFARVREETFVKRLNRAGDDCHWRGHTLYAQDDVFRILTVFLRRSLLPPVRGTYQDLRVTLKVPLDTNEDWTTIVDEVAAVADSSASTSTYMHFYRDVVDIRNSTLLCPHWMLIWLRSQGEKIQKAYLGFFLYLKILICDILQPGIGGMDPDLMEQLSSISFPEDSLARLEKTVGADRLSHALELALEPATPGDEKANIKLSDDAKRISNAFQARSAAFLSFLLSGGLNASKFTLPTLFRGLQGIRDEATTDALHELITFCIHWRPADLTLLHDRRASPQDIIGRILLDSITWTGTPEALRNVFEVYKVPNRVNRESTRWTCNDRFLFDILHCNYLELILMPRRSGLRAGVAGADQEIPPRVRIQEPRPGPTTAVERLCMVWAAIALSPANSLQVQGEALRAIFFEVRVELEALRKANGPVIGPDGIARGRARGLGSSKCGPISDIGLACAIALVSYLGEEIENFQSLAFKTAIAVLRDLVDFSQVKLSISNSDVPEVLNRLIVNRARLEPALASTAVKLCATLATESTSRRRLITAGLASSVTDAIADTFNTTEVNMRSTVCKLIGVLASLAQEKMVVETMNTRQPVLDFLLWIFIEVDFDADVKEIYPVLQCLLVIGTSDPRHLVRIGKHCLHACLAYLQQATSQIFVKKVLELLVVLTNNATIARDLENHEHTLSALGRCREFAQQSDKISDLLNSLERRNQTTETLQLGDRRGVWQQTLDQPRRHR